MKPTVLVITCEHGGNDVPKPYQVLFADSQEVLETHRALDLGVLPIADYLGNRFGCDYIKTTVTRLLIDCNRRLNHPHCFSEFSKSLPKKDKQALIDEVYYPHRKTTADIIQRHIDAGKQVLHLSIHSFTPELNGVTRNSAISLLYDTKRHGEREVARIWQNLILIHPPAYRVRLNYPYTGASDGFTSSLRKLHSEHDYLGIEVECNQALTKDKESLNTLCLILGDSLHELLQII